MSEPRSIESIVNSIINLSEERKCLDPVYCADVIKMIDKRIEMFEGMLNDRTIERNKVFN